MNDLAHTRTPPAYERLLGRARELGFALNSDVLTGAFLRTLAASKPRARVLELGTGCGLGTSWLLDGLDAASTLVSIDSDPRAQAIASFELGADPRLTLIRADARVFLETSTTRFDLIFADAWPGKYTHLDAGLNLLDAGGIYVMDDMLPQPNWPEGHGARVAALIAEFERLPGFEVTKLSWSTGLILAVRR